MNAPVLAQQYMQRALELARRGTYSSQPNPRVGCVIVRDGEIVGEGWHQRAGGPHAEVGALAQAGAGARGAELYVTLEPCSHHGRTPPCADALIAAGLRKVVAAMSDPNPKVAGQGLARLRAAGIEVESGVCELEARELNRGYLARMTRGTPWVTLKLAASADGRSAMASGESQWITGAHARADVHRLRAQAGAVLTTADTVLADDPALTVRDFAPPAGCTLRQPDRIVLDARARVGASAKVWQDDGARTFHVTGANHRLDAGGHIVMPDALRFLAQQEINEVLVECGPRLAGALLAQDLADELVLYMAPSLLGHDARAMAVLPGLTKLDQRVVLEWLEAAKIGSDLRLTARPACRKTRDK